MNNLSSRLVIYVVGAAAIFVIIFGIPALWKWLMNHE